jgi:site-specific recombinase XerD
MEIPITTLIDLFLTTKRTEGRSPRTIGWYREKLSPVARFLNPEGEATLADFTLANIRAFVADLQGREERFADHPGRPTEPGGLSAHTIQGYVRAVKAFSAWLDEEEFTSGSRLAKLKRPKVGEPVIEVLSEAEIAALIGAINPDTFLGGRLYAILLLLLDTGIRATECCTLTLANTHLDEDHIKVLGKGNKERIVPLGATTKKALLRYITTWRPEPALPTIDTVFLAPDGQPLTYSGLSQLLKRLGKRAGVPRLRAHLCRHTFAVRYLMNGGDLMSLRLILGHTTIAVTQMYLHLADAHIQVQHSKFSPIDRLGIRRRRNGK